MTAEFLKAIMEYPPDPELRLEIRCMKPGTKSVKERAWYALDQIDQAATDIEIWREKLHVYHGVLPRVGEGGTQLDVVVAGWLWCDIDGGEGGTHDAIRLLQRSPLPPPHIIVLSGSGAHAYWKLSHYVDLVTERDHHIFKDVLKRVCVDIGGAAPSAHADESRADSASILRPPATLNHKTDPARPVMCCRMRPDEPANTYEWWRAHLPPIPTGAPIGTTTSTGHLWGHEAQKRLPTWATRWAKEPSPDGERYREIRNTAIRLRRDYGFEEDQILPLLEQKVEVSGAHVNKQDLLRMVRWNG